jgi:hypothetical protein
MLFKKLFLRCRAIVSSWLAEGWTMLRGGSGGSHQKTLMSKSSFIVSENNNVNTVAYRPSKQKSSNVAIPNWWSIRLYTDKLACIV